MFRSRVGRRIPALNPRCIRVTSWLDVFDVKDTAAVRAGYEEERARGGYEIPDLRGPSEKTVQDPDEPVWFGAP